MIAYPILTVLVVRLLKVVLGLKGARIERQIWLLELKPKTFEEWNRAQSEWESRA